MKWGLLGGMVLGSLSAVAQLTRVANNTLNMPANPVVYGYTVQKQFGRAFTSPVALVTPPGETNRLFIVEKVGRISVITNLAAATPTVLTFLDVRSKVLFDNEQGLLGLAFHPNYAVNGYFYVFYVTPGARYDRLSRFQVSAGDRNMADPNSEVILINQPDDYVNHNGGDLHFGSDGYLYVSLGDEGGGGDSGSNSQRIDKDFFSGILRIDVDKRQGNLAPNAHPASSNNYSVPADNPFVGATSFNGLALADPSRVRSEFWAVGLRNPWRFSFDSVSGALWCGDVGQELYEEIDVITRGGNYGWVYREGLHSYSGTPPTGFRPIDPVYEYPHGNGNLCVIGGVVYRGNRMPQIYGAYIFGDYGSGNIWALRLNEQGKGVVEALTSSPRITAFGIDPSNGDVLLCGDGDDSIWRLVYSTNSTGSAVPSTLAQTGAFSDLANLTPNAGIVPYDINLPFWSDGANKTRWFSIPDPSGTFAYKPTDSWTTPAGAVWIKHFDMQMVQGDPSSTRRLETRFIVRNTNGVYGVTYRWTNQTSAILVPEGGMDEPLTIRDGGGTIRTQIWHYPSRSECLVCHNATAGWVLGMNSPQLNRNHAYGSVTDNQITALQNAGYLSNTPDPVSSIIALAKPDDTSATLEFRFRSYLAANCSQCHRPGGAGLGNFDTRISTPTDQANLINGSLIDTLGDPANRTLVFNSPEHSMILRRLSVRGATQMPPLASNLADQAGINLVQSFIGSSSKPQLTITADNKTKVYGSANPTLTVTYSGFVNGDGPSVVSGLVLSTVATAGSGVGAYAITGSGATASNYTIVYVNGTLTVTRASLTIAAQNKSRVYGSSNPALTASFTGFVNGDTSSSLDTPVSLSTTATQSSPVGNYTIKAQGATDANYSISFVDGTLTVSRAPLTVKADDKVKVYGAANPPLTASYSGFVNGDTSSVVSGLALSTTASASSGVGAYAITGSGATAANYSITYLSGALNVTPAPLTITAQNKSKVYGTMNPALTANYTGFVNGDTSASLDTPVSLSTTGAQGSPVGVYAIKAQGASDVNYSITFADGTLTISKAPLTVRADDKTRLYGAANPPLTASYSGLVNGDTPSAVSGLTLSTAASASSSVGAYAITAGAATAANYAIAFVNGTLSVTPAPLSIVAQNKSKLYGAVNPALTADYIGLVNGDTPASLDTGVTLSTMADQNSVAGKYAIKASGASDVNYAITFVDGELTVSKAALTVRADNKAKVYGEANPALTATYTGFVNGDTPATLETPVTLSTTANQGSSAGSYAITAQGASDLNYAITFVDGTLSVAQAPLTARADDKAKPYGAANPPLTVTYSGFVNGDTAASLDTPATLSTTADQSSPAGSYPITVQGASDLNYAMTFIDGTLTVSKAALTVRADDKSKVYGAVNPTLTASYVGFIDGDTPASLDTPVILSTEADQFSSVGNYTITAQGATDSKYAITFVDGTLNVGPAPLTITAQDKRKQYGAPNPVFTATYSGFVNGDTTGMLDTQAIFSTTADEQSERGRYPINVSGAADSNYSITFVPGTLTVYGGGTLKIRMTSGAHTLMASEVQIELTIDGDVLDGEVHIEYSDDLTHWTDLPTESPITSLPATVLITPDPAQERVFYRVIFGL